MADQGKPKLTDAIKDRQPKLADALKDQQPKVDGGDGKSVHPEQEPDRVKGSEVPQNSHVNAGFQSRDDFLVHVGRGQDTKGRGSQKG